MASSTTITQQNKSERSLSPWQIARKKFLRNKLAMASTVFIIIVTVISLLAPFLAPYLSPNPDITKVNIGSMNIQPNGEHILGTDKSGRDVLTRLFYGGRVSLLVGFSATLMVITLGTVVGSIAGFFGGAVDSILMRFTDFVLNFPFLVFVIVLNTVLYGIVDGLWVLIMV